MTTPADVYDPIPDVVGAKRVTICAACKQSYLQTLYEPEEGDECEPFYWPSDCQREKCRAALREREEIAADANRRKLPLDHIWKRVDSGALRLAELLYHKAPEVLVENERALFRKFVDELLARSPINRGGPRE